MVTDGRHPQQGAPEGPSAGADFESGSAAALLPDMLQTRAQLLWVYARQEWLLLRRSVMLQLAALALLTVAGWAGVVLLAVVLPPAARAWVLGAVLLLLVLGAVLCLMRRREQAGVWQPTRGRVQAALSQDLQELLSLLRAGRGMGMDREDPP